MSQREYSLTDLTKEAKQIIGKFTKSSKLINDDELVSLVIHRLTNYQEGYNPKLSSLNTFKLNVCKNEIFNYINSQKTNKRKMLNEAIPMDSLVKITDTTNPLSKDLLKVSKHSKRSKNITNERAIFNEILEYVETLPFEETFLFKSYYIDGLLLSEIAEVLNTTSSCQVLRMKKLVAKIHKKFDINLEAAA
jgi:RNA polymerase sigma factor (sigma-70 family)